MSVLRLVENIKMNSGDRFILFYGNINDEFCDDDLVLGNIDFMLWRYFKEQGCRRIVFFDGADKLTFYDHESRRLCLPEQASVASSEGRGSSSLKGPLGRRNLLRAKSSGVAGGVSSPPPTAVSNSPGSSGGGAVQQQRRMSDLSALEILDYVIQSDHSSVPTAVIFPLAEDIRNFQGTSLREIQNRMLKWVKSSSQKCVFIFQQSTLEAVKDIVRSYELHIVVNFINEKQQGNDSSNMIRVGYPDEQEIANLFHHYRIQKGLNVDWRIFYKIAQFLAKQRLTMKGLNSRISGVHELNKNILREWNKTRFVNTTEYLIENLERETYLDKNELQAKLAKVRCQEDNMNLLVDSVASWYGKKHKKSPLTLMFVGTSGVGKTYTAEILAEALRPMGYGYCYFDANQFKEQEAATNLVGSPTGFIGSDTEPKIFRELNNWNNKLVILFDEVDKAHESFLERIMQMLEKGLLSWSKGEGDFRECIICFTSNARMDDLGKFKTDHVSSGGTIKDIKFGEGIKKILGKEGMASFITGRIEHFLVFNALTPEAVIEITHQEVNALAREYDSTLSVVYTAPEFLAEMAKEAAMNAEGSRIIKKQVNLRLGPSFSELCNLEVKHLAVVKENKSYKVMPISDELNPQSIQEMVRDAINIFQLKSRQRSVIDKGQLQAKLAKVRSQEDNMNLLVDSVASWYGKKHKKSPLTLMFVGTSGVGKTYTAEILAEALRPMGYGYCYFDANQFKEQEAATNLVGSPTGFIGSDTEPKIFRELNNWNNKLVILFDEADKAHKSFLERIMQMLEKGLLSWSKGEGDFRECIICFTSNARMDDLIKFKTTYINSGGTIKDIKFGDGIKKILGKEGMASFITGRIEHFLVFNTLTPEAVIEITHQEVNALAKEYDSTLSVVYTAPEFLAEMAEEAAMNAEGSRIIKKQVNLRLGPSFSELCNLEVKYLAVVKENNTYQIAHVTSDSQIPSYEEMISGAIKLVSAGKKITTAQSSIAEPNIKPKRLLHLHELPTSLPKKSDPLSKGANPLKCVLPAVGYVEIEEQDGQESSGSGFVITPDGKFVTSYHVIENARSIRVRFDDRPHEWFSAKLLDGDKEADIAVLKLEGNNFSYALIVTYGDKVELGENVGLLGYPLGEELGSRITYTAGVISSFRRQTGGTSLYQIDANAYHGNSGGPLVRLCDGRIIGILMGGWKEAVQMNFAVSTNEIYKRLVTEY